MSHDQQPNPPPPGPYAQAAGVYWQAGWRGCLPLPARAKKHPPTGYTGRDGAWPSYPDVQAWVDDREGAGNIGLRLPPDVIGVDVDQYDKKPGGFVLTELETKLGPLPPTWRATSRDDGMSGIRFYRVPVGLRWPGVLGPGIETIRHEHRYAVVWPSIHPNGGTYRWITPDGATAARTVPTIDDLPTLPDAWIHHATKGETATDQPRADLSNTAATKWLTDADSGLTPPCRRIASALTHNLTDLTAGGSRHDAALALTNRLIWLAGEGHVGVHDALTSARTRFLGAATDRADGEAEAEWDRMVVGAVRLAAAAHPTVPDSDPCDNPFAGLIPPRKDKPCPTPKPVTPNTLGTPKPNTVGTSAAPPTVGPVAAAVSTGSQTLNQTAAAADTTATPPGDDPPPRTSWWPHDLEPILTGELTEPEPEYLTRDDGQALFYPGKINGLIGPSESGKTWLALAAMAGAIRDGRNVTIIDCEDTDQTFVMRLRTLGVTDPQITEHVAYIGPDQALDLFAADDLREHLGKHQPALIVLDGFNAAMTLLGLDLISNTDATRFAQLLLKPLAATGAAVLYVDHTPKSKENDTAGGIGAQAKRAMTSGCALKVEVIKAFGKGQDGKLRLRVDKDRPGVVRGHSLPGSAGHWCGDAIIGTNPDGGLTVTVTAPHGAGVTADGSEVAPFRPTILMERVSSFLATTPDGASLRTVVKTVRGNEKHLQTALDRLVEEGFVDRSEIAGNGGSRLVHVSIKPFTEADGLIAQGVAKVSPRCRQETPWGEAVKVSPIATIPVGLVATPSADPGHPEKTSKTEGVANDTFCRSCGAAVDTAHILDGQRDCPHCYGPLAGRDT